MTRTDSFVVGTLVALFAIIAGLVAVPALLPVASPGATPGVGPGSVAARPYREGMLGRPVSVSPLSARTQADRDLVALVYSGLVRNGPAGTIVPDLAEHWAVDVTGAVWTFQLRPDARWHDGEPVTAEDVVFTIHLLQAPGYSGPAAGSWREVTVEAVGTRTVVFTLAPPLGGFLQAATQPIVPAHLLAGIPVDELQDHPFGRQPVGSGPFAVTSLTADTAELVPAITVLPEPDPSSKGTPRATDSLSTPGPADRPSRPIPYLAGMEFRFFDDPAALAAAYRQGGLDAASGLSPALTRELALAQDSRALRYPGSTLTAVFLNLRPGHPFPNPVVRTALLAAIDRPRLVTEAFAMAAIPATSLIPPTSVMFDPTADPPVRYDPAGAQAALKKAGWTRAADGWHLPKAAAALSIELVSPNEDSNPAAFAVAQAVARDWTSLGLTVTHTPLAPGEFVNGRLATGRFSAAVGDVTVGLDPDLYPLLASSQTLTGGSNVIGLQDPALDALLVAARGPGVETLRMAAYAKLQKQLATGQFVLPIAFADESIVVRDTLDGPAIRQVAGPADRFWDVLTWRLAADR